MGKMKEKFLEDQEKAIQDAIDAFMDDDYQLEEYYASMKPEDCSGNCEECECPESPCSCGCECCPGGSVPQIGEVGL